jgi:hypothetical protein
MNPMSLDSSGERFVISIDKHYINKDFLMQLLERIRVEYLAQKIDFDEGLEQLGEQVKSDWWEQHKGQFIKE